MKKSTIKSYDELPLFLNAEMLAQVLGVSQATAYELLHEESFPKLKIGNRIVIPKEKFVEWVSANTKGDVREREERRSHPQLLPGTE